MWAQTHTYEEYREKTACTSQGQRPEYVLPAVSEGPDPADAWVSEVQPLDCGKTKVPCLSSLVWALCDSSPSCLLHEARLVPAPALI